jgi:hypothetical protein
MYLAIICLLATQLLEKTIVLTATMFPWARTTTQLRQYELGTVQATVKYNVNTGSKLDENKNCWRWDGSTDVKIHYQNTRIISSTGPTYLHIKSIFQDFVGNCSLFFFCAMKKCWQQSHTVQASCEAVFLQNTFHSSSHSYHHVRLKHLLRNILCSPQVPFQC